MVNEIQNRTKKLAIDIIKFCSILPQKQEYWIISKQLIRSATSVGANYRSACRARSKADFTNKLGVVEEEADESALWMELLVESGLVPQRRLANLLDEAHPITAILVASRKSLISRT